MRGFAVSALIAFCAFADASAQSVETPASWYLIAADSGATLGYVSVEVTPSGDGRDIIESQQINLREQGGLPYRAITRTVVHEDGTGRAVSVDASTRIGRYSTRTTGQIGARRVEVMRETPMGRTREIVELPEGVRFDDGDALVQNWQIEVNPRLDFLSFDSDTMAVERIVIEALAPPDANGRVNALKLRYDGENLRGVNRLVLERGRIIEIAQPMFGETIRTRLSTREDATRRRPAYEVIPNMAVRSPYRISPEARRGHIRYRFAFRDAVTFPLPQTGEQRLSVADGIATLDICETCGPGLPTDTATLADASRPTSWLQSDHPRLQAMAAAVRGFDVSDARKMELLLARAIPYLEDTDFNGHYSALETLERRAGDCTEAAVLLAALGRAAGIPTRVASGFSYSRESYHGVSNAFIPHSWTLAYVDGAWRSFDLSLREFDSAHIALTIGDGDPRSIAAAGQLASLLRLNGLAEVRARSSR